MTSVAKYDAILNIIMNTEKLLIKTVTLKMEYLCTFTVHFLTSDTMFEDEDKRSKYM